MYFNLAKEIENSLISFWKEWLYAGLESCSQTDGLGQFPWIPNKISHEEFNSSSQTTASQEVRVMETYLKELAIKKNVKLEEVIKWLWKIPMLLLWQSY